MDIVSRKTFSHGREGAGMMTGKLRIPAVKNRNVQDKYFDWKRRNLSWQQRKRPALLVDSTIISEETVTTEEKVAAAKKANTRAKAANKEAAKKSTEAAAAVAKDTAEKVVEQAKDVAEKTKTAAKKTAARTKKAVKEAAEAAPKRKYNRKPTKKRGSSVHGPGDQRGRAD